MDKKFLIIDGNSIMNRAFYGVKLLTTKDGLYTNAVYGFLNIYFMIKDMLSPDYVAVTFDLSAPTFRHEKYKEYKAHRKSMPEELRVQMPVIKDVLRALNISIIEKEGFEADDLIGTIAKKNETNSIHTYILTGDRDSFQLISKLTTVILPTSKPGKTDYLLYDEALLKDKYGIAPSQVVDVKAIMGDSSDNIPGIPGIGEKTAYPLIIKYKSLNNIYQNIDSLEVTKGVLTKLRENESLARLSYELATINRDVPITFEYNLMELGQIDLKSANNIFSRLEFKKFIDKFGVSPKEESNLFKNIDVQFVKEASQFENIVLSDMYLTLTNNFACGNILALLTNNKIYAIDLASKDLQAILNKLNEPEVMRVGYNIKRIYRLFFENKIDHIKSFDHDIMLEYYLLNAVDTNSSMENIAYKMLNISFPILESKKKNVQTSLFEQDTSSLTLDEQEKNYISLYMQSLMELEKLLTKKIKQEQLEYVYNEIELPLSKVLADIETKGMYIDKSRLQAFGEELEEKLLKLQNEIYDLAGEQFNVNSPQQLAKILFEKMQIPFPKKTKSYSTDKEILESIQDKHEIINKVLDYRMYSKLKSTYVDGLISCIADDNRIHTTFTQTVAVTGRLSSIEPNLQNIPVRTEEGAKIRECFVATENNYILDADYSQIELRVLAHIANDINMIKAFNSGLDVHSVTASEVFGVPIENVTKELRFRAKAVNFGIVYGISEYGLAKNISCSTKEAAEYITNYLAHYNGIDLYMKNVIEDAKKEGFVKTIFGRKREVSELKSSNYMTRMFGSRVAMNMPIQGTAADIMKIATIDLYNAINKNNLTSKIIMQVHDELILEVPSEEVEIMSKIVKDCMENAYNLSVPLKVDLNVAKSWFEAK